MSCRSASNPFSGRREFGPFVTGAEAFPEISADLFQESRARLRGRTVYSFCACRVMPDFSQLCARQYFAELCEQYSLPVNFKPKGLDTRALTRGVLKPVLDKN